MSKFTFGTSATSGPATSQSTTAGGIFGNVGGSQPTTGASASPFSAGTSGNPLFGGAGGGGAGFGFSAKPPGQNTDEKQGSTSLFGSTTPAKPLGQGAAGQSNPPPLFGAAAKTTTAAPSLFGSTTPGPSGLFGNPSTTPAGPPPQSSSGQNSLFGKTPQPTSGSGTGLLFSNQTKPSADQSATPATSAPASTFLGNAGQQQAQPFGNLLSGKKDDNAAKPNAGSLFSLGGNKQPATQSASATPTTTTETKPGGGFSLTGTQPTAQKPGSLFSPPAAGSQPSQPFSLTSSTPTQPPPSSSSATPTETPKPLFGSLTTPSATAAPATSTPAASNSPFTLNTPKATTTTTDSTKAAAPSGQPGGMFSNLGKPAASSTAATGAPATTATAPASTAAATTATPAVTATTTPSANTGGAGTGPNLGASTVGPAPPAQSRLKNKTMDEIITRWATDLTKYQKEFQEQAEQVAEWDRMLVENGAKVQKLYGNTVDAERATQEVERQLASVEGQQEELSSWLDRYEQEVETLLSKQVGMGDTLQGPDQERERTYKLAEKLSERLNDMGQDLTSMIEEVNSATASLSKTSKADEPISQIVRILNSHLSQLQVIDQSTATLRAKISATQKAGNSIGGGYRNGTPGSVGGGAADDFYRSYMGRR